MFNKKHQMKLDFIERHNLETHFVVAQGKKIPCFLLDDIRKAIQREELSIRYMLMAPLTMRYNNRFEPSDFYTVVDNLGDMKYVALDYFGNWILANDADIFIRSDCQHAILLHEDTSPDTPEYYVIKVKEMNTGEIFEQLVYDVDMDYLLHIGNNTWARMYKDCPVCGRRILWDNDMCIDCRNNIAAEMLQLQEEDDRRREEREHRYSPHYTFDDEDDYEGEEYEDEPFIKSYGSTNLPVKKLEDEEPDKTVGVELEIDHGGESDLNARYIVSNCKDVECKHDSSLDDGFEIASAPCSVRYHLEKFPWESFVERAKELGYSHNPSTAGMHIHIGRDFFKGDQNQEELFGLFINHYHEQLCEIFCRDDDEYCQSFDPDDDEFWGIRKQNVNYNNENTIEVRLFGSVLDYSHIRAAIQFVDVLADVVRQNPDLWVYEILLQKMKEVAKDRNYTELLERLNLIK